MTKYGCEQAKSSKPNPIPPKIVRSRFNSIYLFSIKSESYALKLITIITALYNKLSLRPGNAVKHRFDFDRPDQHQSLLPRKQRTPENT